MSVQPLIPQEAILKTPAAAAHPFAFINRRFRDIQAGILAVSDALMIFTGFMLGFWLRSHSGIAPPGTMPSVRQGLLLVPWLVVIWVLAAPAFDISLYRSGYGWTHLLVKIVQAALLATLVSLVFNQFYGVHQSHLAIIFGWMISLILIGITRYGVHLASAGLRSRGIGVVRVAILGTEPSAADVIDTIKSNPEIGYRVVGVITDSPAARDISGFNAPFLGSADQIRQIVAAHSIDELIVAPVNADRERVLNVLAEFETDAITVRVLSSIIDAVARPVEVGAIGNHRLIAFREHALSGWGGLAKRAIDFIVSLLALVILAPLFAMIAAAIKLSSHGPVFYRQIRIGRDDRPFAMFKFRSMRVDAERDSGAVWATQDDPRRTRVGRILRRLSVDELPQFWNVLIGDMSLVGPRPERPEFVNEFRKRIPRYLRRHKAKAGITGWAQAHGWRGNTPIEKRIECDLWYIANWSLSLDFEIMLKTVKELLFGRNAY